MSLSFGIGLRRYDTIVADAREAEEQGFDFASIGEHVFFHGPIGNGLIALAAAAGATANIRLLSAITLVPLYPAALLAKQVATLDVVSGGRFDLGVGVGGEYEPEFIACGVKRSQRGARTDEALEVIARLYAEDEVHFSGRFTQLEGVTLAPKPVQAGGPPVWVSGRSEAAMRRCATYGDYWLPYMYTPEHLANSIEKIKSFGEELGIDLSDFTFAIYIFSAVHEDNDTAVKYAAERLSKQYAQDFSQLVHKYALAGDPDKCKARLQEYIDAGASAVFVSSACPDDYIDTNLEMLANTVIPAFR